MIRGAFILAVGFSLGYAKALSEQDKVVNALKDLTYSMTTSTDTANASDTSDDAVADIPETPTENQETDDE